MSDDNELICTICGTAYEGEDGLSFCCGDCGRCGFCEYCAEPENHDCDKMEKREDLGDEEG